MKIHQTSLLKFLLLLFALNINAQGLITNAYSRETYSLNGDWNYLLDPYETGFFDYRFKEKHENDPNAYWNYGIPNDKTALIEHQYSSKQTLKVPQDWNSQEPKFLYYEGTVWYQKSFDFQFKHDYNRLFIYFGAVN